MLAVLTILVVLFGLLSRHFWTLRTLQSIINQVPDLMVIATGMTLVLVAGGIDLSVGSVLALAGVISGYRDGRLGLAVGAGNRLVPGRGCCLRAGKRTGLGALVDPLVYCHAGDARNRARNRLSGHRFTDQVHRPAGRGSCAAACLVWGFHRRFLAAIVVVLLAQILLTRTVWGRYIVAVGANEQAARFSGIATRCIKLTTFVLSGLMAALGAIFQVARLSSADPNGGIGMELSAIAAVVIGGTSLIGGHGSVFRSFLGVLIIAVLQTGLAQVGATVRRGRPSD